MAEYSAPNRQIINPGESVVFTTTVIPCNRGFVMFRNNSGVFVLVGYVPYVACCPCAQKNAIYAADFGANIAVPEGQTVGPISVALTLEGSTLQDTVMTVTPAAVEEFFNISRATSVSVFRGCCETFSVKNISSIPIAMTNANVVLTRPDLVMSR